MGYMRNCMICVVVVVVAAAVVVVLASDDVCSEPRTNKTVNGHNRTASFCLFCGA